AGGPFPKAGGPGPCPSPPVRGPAREPVPEADRPDRPRGGLPPVPAPPRGGPPRWPVQQRRGPSLPPPRRPGYASFLTSRSLDHLLAAALARRGGPCDADQKKERYVETDRDAP